MYTIKLLENRSEDTVSVCFSGIINHSELINLIDSLVGFEEKYPAHKLIVDFIDVVQVDLDYQDIMSIVDYVKEHDTRAGIAALVTGPKKGRYFLAKLYTDMLKIFVGKENKAFKEKRAAYNWLGIPCQA